jgi:glycosyltransferase involved in cell wall biosynthesis
VSVIVPVRNASRRMPAFLAALAAQTLPRGDFEVLIVDDASTDATRAAVRAARVATLIELDQHGGPYLARNEAAARARGAVLAFTDSDCLPDPAWLEHGLAELEQSEADMVAGRIEVPLDAGSSATALVDYMRSFDQEASVERGFAATANLFVRRRLFDREGGFNHRLLAGGDKEFGLRAVENGGRLAYAELAVVVHAPRARPRELARKSFRRGFGLAQVARYAAPGSARRVQPCTRFGNYVPRWQLAGADRLRRRGWALSRRRQVAMRFSSYLCCQVPLLTGNLAGILGESSVLRLARRLK